MVIEVLDNQYKHLLTLKYFAFRKPVDPEAAKYYSEIENVIRGTEVDLEERSIMCSNALEESKLNLQLIML